MRDRETIDSESRRVAAELRSIRERGGRPSSRQLDALLDERLGHPADALCDIAILDEICLPADEAAAPPPPVPTPPCVAGMFPLHPRRPTPPPTATPPSDVQASPAAQAQAPFIP